MMGEVMMRHQMLEGLRKGRTLIQEEWADPDEIRTVDDLIAEGLAQATPWEWRDNFQCERRRITIAAPGATSAKIAQVR